jgi:hypothetical protein
MGSILEGPAGTAPPGAPEYKRDSCRGSLGQATATAVNN